MHSNPRNIYMRTLDQADVDVMKATKTCVAAHRFQYDYLNDDINDSGNTICVLREAIEAAGGDLSNVRVAVMINNVSSIEQVDYSVQTIDRKVTKDWFVFPREAVGTQEHIERDAAEEPSRTA